MTSPTYTCMRFFRQSVPIERDSPKTHTLVPGWSAILDLLAFEGEHLRKSFRKSLKWLMKYWNRTMIASELEAFEVRADAPGAHVRAERKNRLRAPM